MTEQKKILIMAGGTGGHVFPALAVGKKLAQAGWAVRWLGTPDRMEARLVPQHGFDISFIDIKGVRGNGLVRKLLAPMQVTKAVWQSLAVIREFKPDVVLGMGGFASGPGGVAAKLAGIPIILHEQNAIAGVTNKLLSRVASQVLCAFPTESFAHRADIDIVGNPIRAELIQLGQQKSEARQQQQEQAQKAAEETPALKVLAVGGSLGAKVLNDVLPEVMTTLTRSHSVTLWHQVGAGNLAGVEQAYQQKQLAGNVQVSEFIDDMEAAYRWADVIVCRSGALTVSEVAAVGLPSILVPYPHAVDDHQTLNAKVLVDAGAGYLMPQAELTAANLLDKLTSFAADHQLLVKMSQQAQQVAVTDATEKVASACIHWATSTKN